MIKTYLVKSQGVAERFSDAFSRLRATGDFVIVARGIPRAMVMLCPDGCGETLTVNLDHRSGPAWRKYERKGKLTIYPSVWRESGCRAHFIIWNDRVIWCGVGENDTRTFSEPRLFQKVQSRLPVSEYVHFEQLADSLDEIPWDVHWACSDLVRQGLAEEGKRGTFRKRTPKNSTDRSSFHILG